MDSDEIIQGPLSDLSRDDDSACSSHNDEEQNIKKDSQLTSSKNCELSSDLENLSINPPIYFRPGGSEAFLFTGGYDYDDSCHESTPREIDDGFLLDEPPIDKRVFTLLKPSPKVDKLSLGLSGTVDKFVPDQDNVSFSDEITNTTERSVSPSAASGISGVSSVTGRKYLEWDSGADVGYVPTSKEPGTNLSALEKMAIGNYSSYFRNEPKSKPSKNKYTPLKNLLPSNLYNDEEMRRLRLARFADSLLTQKKLAEVERDQRFNSRAPDGESSNVTEETLNLSKSISLTDIPHRHSPVDSSSSTGTVIPLTYPSSKNRNQDSELSLVNTEQVSISKSMRKESVPRSTSSRSSSKRSVNTVIVHQPFDKSAESSEDTEDEARRSRRASSNVDRPGFTTSEDEAKQTLDSVRIDRVGSFEYFPGESYQEISGTKPSANISVDRPSEDFTKLSKIYKQKLKSCLAILASPNRTKNERKAKRKLAEALLLIVDENDPGTTDKLRNDISKLEEIEKRTIPISTSNSSISLKSTSEFGHNCPTPTNREERKSLSFFFPFNGDPMEKLDKENVRPLSGKVRSQKILNKKSPSSYVPLKEALFVGNPAFVKKAEQRIQLLKESKRQREVLSSKRRKWVEEVALLSPESRAEIAPTYTPIRVQRVFNYSEMVKATKNRFAKLPESIKKEECVKKKTSNITNKIMSQMYSKSLQQKALKGKVSLVH